MHSFQLDSDDDYEPSNMFAAENRSFEQDFLGKYSNSARVFANDFKHFQDDTLFKNGFVFKNTPPDHMLVPHQYDDEDHLFKQFYEKLIESEVLNHYIDEMENFFVPNGKPNIGCKVESISGIHVGHTHSGYEFIEHEVNFKSKKAVQKYTANGKMMKGIYCKEKIEEGELILQEKPLILCKSPNCLCSGNLYFECSYCTRSEKGFYVCHDCDVTIYCSEQCRSDAHREYHSFECKAYKCHFFAKKDPMWVAFRMLMIGSVYRFETNSENKYKFICKTPMRNSGVNILSVLQKATLILLYLIKYTKYFEYITAKQNCFPGTTLYEKYLKIGGLLIRHALQAYSATFYFPDEMISLNTESKGGRFETPALCIGAASFTHACKPNATIIFTDNFYAIKALKTINVSDIITINYVHLDEMFYGDSRKYPCNCEECLYSKNKYTGRLYKCFKCESPHGQQMERYPPMWKCLDCNTYKKNAELDGKIDALDKMFQQIAVLDTTDYADKSYIPEIYLDFYQKIYADYYPEYLYVLQKVVVFSIENLHIENACTYGAILFDKLSLLLHKYSFQRLEALVSIVNNIARTFYDKKMNSVHLIELGRVALENLQPICDFYALMKHYSELIQLLDSIEDIYVVREEADPIGIENKTLAREIVDMCTTLQSASVSTKGKVVDNKNVQNKRKAEEKN